MSSSIDISTYSSPVLISDSNQTYVAIQVSSDSALDADITVKLQQSNDDQLIDISGTTNTISLGANTVLIETNDFTTSSLYLHVDVGSATLGTLSIMYSGKKKEYSGDVDATIIGDVQVVADPNMLDNTEEIKGNTQLLNSILKQLKQINKTLIKIYQ